MTEEFREVGKRLSNWGRWGSEDALGTLNHITDARRLAAVAEVRSGTIFDLGIEVTKDGIQAGTGSRVNPSHLMSLTPVDFAHRADRMFVADDYVYMPLQSVTQWDGLGHVGYDGLLYNGYESGTITTRNGSLALSIHEIARTGVVGRGVLLDIARLQGVDRLPAGFAIGPDLLDAAEKAQGVTAGPGDILMVRTGWIRNWTQDRDVAGFWAGEPGLSLETADWLHARDIAAVAVDNWAVEVTRPEMGLAGSLPLHCVLIRDVGMTLGEIFNFDALAEACAAEGRWSCLLSAPPVKVVGGVGTPLTPVAML
ncbi:cyclase family protein [Nitratireductor alexandrii]|uniref:cyclase family protein n=1 Tax=Nitratireductor alexandrii TaxID=2448161 RepID=UPI000FD860DF|nr:cyclase family protein [Nitratireductor alexandrii]